MRSRLRWKMLWLANQRRAGGCAFCGSYAYLEFHHTHDKLLTISDMIHDGRYPIDTFQKELDKCIVLCRRCHVKLHQSGITPRYGGLPLTLAEACK